ncbi:hypothetical protein [Sporosarcina sp. FA9]
MARPGHAYPLVEINGKWIAIDANEVVTIQGLINNGASRMTKTTFE